MSFSIAIWIMKERRFLPDKRVELKSWYSSDDMNTLWTHTPIQGYYAKAILSWKIPVRDEKRVVKERGEHRVLDSRKYHDFKSFMSDLSWNIDHVKRYISPYMIKGE